jgi:hypothetical protein
MSLLHNFYCITEAGLIKYKNVHKDYVKMKADVTIHDDLIRYMNDTLLWIPTIHLSGNHYKQTHGLFLYGSTVINKEGASMFSHIISSWAQLFSKAPENFELNGGVTINIDRTVGEFRKIKVNRDDLIKKLDVLKNYAEKAIADEHFILHLGI